MKLSNFINLDPNVLLEYIYNDQNLISVPYEVLINTKLGERSFMESNNSPNANTQKNQLFVLDPVSNTNALIDTNTYKFIQVNNYPSGFPIQFDTIRLHFPINYTFGENIGFKINAYVFDTNNKYTYDISNFYYDITQGDNLYNLAYSSPPLLINAKMWGKYIDVLVPSAYAISNQLTNNSPTSNTINYNLTNGIGISTTSPLFINFQFINSKQTINNINTYTLKAPYSTSVPIVPKYESLGLTIQESSQGDYFEIFGTYNGNISEFNLFLQNAQNIGNNYYVEYTITVFEQNIRGNSITVILNDNFDQPVEYRPIIKYSTTTAIIDVQMSVIDAVDNSQILRTADYGMLPDQVTKYSLHMSKINIANASKPVIYNLKTTMSLGNMNGNANTNNINLQLQPVKVPFPVLIEKYNIIAKSDNVLIGSSLFYGNGQLVISIYPFDNVFSFVLANQIKDGTISYLDMSNLGTINMVIKDSINTVSVTPYYQSGSIDLSKGMVVFLLPNGSVNDVKKIYNGGINLFYITSSSNGVSTVLYTGLFNVYDSKTNVTTLNNNLQTAQPINVTPYVISNTQTPTGVAVVTRQIIPLTQSGTQSMR
jgi:hypothetical protein